MAMEYLGPVSYTHLDVYKRQIFACKYLKVRFGRIPKDSYLKLPYYDDHSFTFSAYAFDGEYYWGMYFVPESHAKEVDDIFANLYFERMWVPDFVDVYKRQVQKVLRVNKEERHLRGGAATRQKYHPEIE